MEQKKLDRKNLIVLAIVVVAIAVVAVVAATQQRTINPTLGTLEADPTETPVVTDAPAVTDVPAVTDAPAETDAPAKKGCKSAVSAAVLPVTLAAAVAVTKKGKKKEEL